LASATVATTYTTADRVDREYATGACVNFVASSYDERPIAAKARIP
jgi:hypothetical protein